MTRGGHRGAEAEAGVLMASLFLTFSSCCVLNRKATTLLFV